MAIVPCSQKERSAFKGPGHIVFFSMTMSGAQKEKNRKETVGVKHIGHANK